MAFITKELSLKTYSDFVLLAEKQGGCWCMYYQRAKPIKHISLGAWGRINKRDKRRLLSEGRAHAILVYDMETPVGWCQYGPSEELPRIDGGRYYRKVKQPTGNRKLWRITCFFVERSHRRKGVAKAGLAGALASIARQGGGTVEAYPVVSRKMAGVPEWLWFGTPRMFEREGFRKVAPLGTSRVLMRKEIAG